MTDIINVLAQSTESENVNEVAPVVYPEQVEDLSMEQNKSQLPMDKLETKFQENCSMEDSKNGEAVIGPVDEEHISELSECFCCRVSEPEAQCYWKSIKPFVCNNIVAVIAIGVVWYACTHSKQVCVHFTK